MAQSTWYTFSVIRKSSLKGGLVLENNKIIPSPLNFSVLYKNRILLQFRFLTISKSSDYVVTSSIQLLSFYLFYSLSAFVSSVQIKLKKTKKQNSTDCLEKCLGCGPALAAKTRCEVMAVLSTPHAHSAIGYSMPFRSIWLAAISMTLMMKAIAKAQIRLFLTHVCLFFFLGWTERSEKRREMKRLL